MSPFSGPPSLAEVTGPSSLLRNSNHKFECQVHGGFPKPEVSSIGMFHKEALGICPLASWAEVIGFSGLILDWSKEGADCRGVRRSDRGYNVIDLQEGIAGYPSLGECSTWWIRGVLEKNLWQGGKANFLTALRELKNWVMGKKLQRGSWSDKKISDDPLSWKCWSFDKNLNCCHFQKIRLWNWT